MKDEEEKNDSEIFIKDSEPFNEDIDSEMLQEPEEENEPEETDYGDINVTRYSVHDILKLTQLWAPKNTEIDLKFPIPWIREVPPIEEKSVKTVIGKRTGRNKILVNSVWNEESDSNFYKEFNSCLNKISKNNFDFILELVIDMAYKVDKLEKLEKISEIIFEKAVLSLTYSHIYGDLCSSLITKNVLPYFTKATNDGNSIILNFRKILLKLCSKDFEEKSFIEIKHQEELSLDRLSELDTKRKERLVGLITFIGDLFIRKIISVKIIKMLLERLLKPNNNGSPESENIEQCVHLLTKIGSSLEEKREKLDSYLTSLESLQEKLETRMQFVIQNLLDLRRNNWKPRKMTPQRPLIKVSQSDLDNEQNFEKEAKEKGGTLIFMTTPRNPRPHIQKEVSSGGDKFLRKWQKKK